MFDIPAVFVDIETNGGYGDRGSITEIALIRVEDGVVTEEYSTLVNPGSAIPHWITRLTGITNDELVDAPYFDEIAADVHRMLDGAIFVAHNVHFDFSFVKRQLEAVGYLFEPKLFCTVRMSRMMYPEHKGHSLEKIINRHAISTKDRHRAYADAKAIFDFARLAIEEKGIEVFRHSVAAQLKQKKLPQSSTETELIYIPLEE